MSKRGYNWKARQNKTTFVDDSATKKIKLDLKDDGHYDKSNELVLPSKKRQTKTVNASLQNQRILTKKKRKLLEKIVDKKRKKAHREKVLEDLAKYQVPEEELSKLTSISTVQTKGIKYFQNQRKVNHKTKEDLDSLPGAYKINSIAGSKRKLLLENRQICKDDPNVVGFNSSGSDDSETEESSQSDTTPKCDVDFPRVTDNQSDSEERNIIESEGDDRAYENDCNTSNDVSMEYQTRTSEGSYRSEKSKEMNSQVNKLRKPAVYVQVERDKEIEKARMKLPILAEEQHIMETINENPVIIIAGETGSGKTTQVPQFLYEAGYALEKMIGITEPRRVAAVSMADRIATEMNLTSKEVSYLIRFEGNVTGDTKIKFMTDGVLLEEVKNDFLLSKYSVIILDEAHERSVNTDILIGLLSRIVPLRNKRGDPLKLIIMSATLRLEDFTQNRKLFKVKPPTLQIDSRQFSVTVHFNKNTNANYLVEAFKKTVKIHTTLPDGGILVFVTGKQEVDLLVRKLKKEFPELASKKALEFSKKIKQKSHKVPSDGDESASEDNDEVDMKSSLQRRKLVKILPKISLDDYNTPNDEDDPDIISDGELSSETEQDFNDVRLSVIKDRQPLMVLPMYSLLSSKEQSKVFQPVPPGFRLCVVSTNVCETSLTIPNIKYVVDSGKTKVKLYDKVTGVTNYVVTWTSKASADQRAGRAGRTTPGHCYRLYSSAVFNDIFEQFSVPEIQKKPIDDLVLQMRCMNINKIRNFPFPTPPEVQQLAMADHRLEILGALKNLQVTPLGRSIAQYPVLPRFGKMLALSHQSDLLPYTISIVAALSVPEVLIETPIGQSSEDTKSLRQKWFSTRKQMAGVGHSLLLGDPMVLLCVAGAAEHAIVSGGLEKFCNQYGLRQKAIIEVRKLRKQLHNQIDRESDLNPQLPPPSDVSAKLLRQILLSGMGDQIAKKVTLEEIKDREDRVKYKYAYHANNMEEPVFMHRGSVLKDRLPEFVIYQEIYETNKMYMRGVTAIEPEWLPVYVPNLCNLSEPLVDPEPHFDESSGKVFCTVTGTFGTQGWPLSNVEIPYPANVDAYKWFAKFLLEGKVFKRLKRYVKSLLHPPTTIVKIWANYQPKVKAILHMLMVKQCCTRGAVEDIWEESPEFLLAEYIQWLPQSAHTEVSAFWPPINKE